MNLLLTDVLDCPSCLTGAGLILLADRVEGRTIYEGRLGCPLCRRNFPVKQGVAEFGVAEGVGAEAAEDAATIAALLGVSEPPATVLLIGRYAQQASELAHLIEGIQVVVADGAAEQTAHPNASVLTCGDVVPLRDRSMRGVWVSNSRQLKEAARVCALASRMVVQGITPQTSGEVESLGFRVMAQDAERLVAVRVS
jgi:uncharacterized protein YbaR (Trm112 family)